MDSDSDAIQALIDDPSSFDEIATDYEDDVKCYDDLLNEAKKNLSSFNEYMQFYTANIEFGPTDYVYHDLKQNATRSLKNMVLGSSRAGKRFPVFSAAELQHRIDSYRDLGVDSVTPRTVTYTILEHILDDEPHESQVYMMLDHLLSDQPDNGPELISLLARARFVFATEKFDSDNPALETHLSQLHDTIPDPLPNDERSPSQLVDESKKKAFADAKKIEFIQASLARAEDETVLQEYLYLTASDIVERYRHQDKADPWRGELQLAVRQFNCLENLYQNNIDTERLARIRSYRQLALAELDSGGRWRSLKDPNNLPEPNFFSAADHYYKAAVAIKSIDPHRYIKYLSKTFRSQGIAVRYRELGPARGWHTTRLIHDRAIDLLTQHVDQFDDNQDAVTETIVGTVGTHTFRRHQAAAVVAFEHQNYDELVEHIDEAWDHLDATPTYEDTELLETLRTLSEALLLEIEGEYTEAYSLYEKTESAQIDIEKRTRLVEIKSDIVQQNHQSALSTAEATFESSSPITTAVQIITGKSPSPPSIYPPLFENLSAVNHETKWWFTLITHLYSKSSQDNDILREQLSETLLSL